MTEYLTVHIYASFLFRGNITLVRWSSANCCHSFDYGVILRVDCHDTVEISHITYILLFRERAEFLEVYFIDH